MRALLPAVLILGLGRGLPAQSVALRVVEDSTRQPLPGVVVRLATGSRVVATGLTGESGRVTLRAPAAGTYQLTAARIGYEGFGPIAFDIVDGEQSRLVVMPRTARHLPPIVVTGGSGCASASGSGTAAATLWEDVRTALTANALTASEGRVTLRVVRFERDLTPDRTFLRERIIRRHVTEGQPFVAEEPAVLLRRGFVHASHDSVHYAAPDAALLLRDEFVDAHCFSARADGPPGAKLGLSFAPVPGRTTPDVTGTLWLDAASRELRYLEFQYTGLDRKLGLGGPGGRIDFRRLENGAWIVNDWSLAMPVVGAVRAVGQPDAVRYRLLGWLVAGGRAVVDTVPELLAGKSAVVSLVTGRVIDSLHGGPLAGASVSLDGEPDTVSTDATGRFTLTVQGSGPRLLRIRHDRLGLVADNSTQEVSLAPGRPAEVIASVPPVERFARTLCQAREGESGIVGIIRGADQVPQEGAEVRASWFTRGPSEQFNRRNLGTRTVARGVFTFCDVPPTGVTLDLDGEKTSIRLSTGQYQWVELARRP